jgi:hypothetical protein
MYLKRVHGITHSTAVEFYDVALSLKVRRSYSMVECPNRTLDEKNFRSHF